ncbi:hypothetical protein FGB62_104g111 [Gracilaria domingensis]|nr:hypothetical protein FGB62_104g111 [Gracilaria domingensis]
MAGPQHDDAREAERVDGGVRKRGGGARVGEAGVRRNDGVRHGAVGGGGHGLRVADPRQQRAAQLLARRFVPGAGVRGATTA